MVILFKITNNFLQLCVPILCQHLFEGRKIIDVALILDVRHSDRNVRMTVRIFFSNNQSIFTPNNYLMTCCLMSTIILRYHEPGAIY